MLIQYNIFRDRDIPFRFTSGDILCPSFINIYAQNINYIQLKC